MSRVTRLNGPSGVVDVAASFNPAIRRPAAAATTLITNFQTGHSFTTFGGSSSNLNDTTDFVSGTQSAYAVSAGAGAGVSITRSNFGPFNMTGMVLEVLMKVTNSTHLGHIQFLLGNTNFTNYYVQTVQGVAAVPGAEYIEEGKWVWVAVPWSPTLAGTPDRTAITDIRITWNDDSTGQLVKIQLDAIRLRPASHSAFPNGVITLCFDDCNGAQWSLGRSKMDQYGYKGSAFVIIDQVDKAGQLTTQNLKDLERLSGWEVCGHSGTTAAHNATGAFTSLTQAQVDLEYRNMKAWLRTGGYYGQDHFAYPQGLINTTVLEATKRYYRTGRLAAAPRANELLPPLDLLKLRTWTSGNDLPSLQAIVDNAKAQASWGIVLFHNIVASGVTDPNNQTLTATFNSFIDYINTQGVPVRTMSDVITALG